MVSYEALFCIVIEKILKGLVNVDHSCALARPCRAGRQSVGFAPVMVVIYRRESLPISINLLSARARPADREAVRSVIDVWRAISVSHH